MFYRTCVVLLLLASTARAEERVSAKDLQVPAGRGSVSLLPLGRLSQDEAVGGMALTSRAGLDADRLAKLVSARLETVLHRSIEKALRDVAITFVVVAPVRDLALTVPVLLQRGSDERGRSQVLTRLVVRLGVSAALAALLAADDDHKGKDLAIHRLRAWDAVYEGLARSPRLRGLGFVGAKGTVVGGYEDLAREATSIAAFFPQLPNIKFDEAANALKETCRTPPPVPKDAPTTAEAPAAPLSAIEDAPPVPTDVPTTAKAPAAPVLKDVPTTAEALAAALSAIYDANPAWKQAEDDSDCGRQYKALIVHADGLKALGSTLLSDLDASRPRRMDAAHLEAYGWLAAVHTVFARNSLTAADVAVVSALLVKRIKTLDLGHPTVQEALIALLEALPLAVVERVKEQEVFGIDLDGPALAEGFLRRVAWADRAGAYLRATAGTGYLVVVSGGAKTDAVPAVYEELGVGWRWPAWDGDLLVGPHVALSGLLHRLVLDEEIREGVFGLLGVSVNFFAAIDVSLNGGVLMAAADDRQAGELMVSVGLQVPLLDYLTAEGE